MNITRRTLGLLPTNTPLVEASCDVCGGRFRTLVTDPADAARAWVDHRCGAGVVGPLWTLIVPPAPVAKRARARRAA